MKNRCNSLLPRRDFSTNLSAWCHAAAIGAWCLLLIPTPGKATGDLTVNGFVAVSGVGVSSQPSWREGGFGRFTLGADTPDDDETYALGQLHVALDWQPSPFFGTYIHVTGRAEPSEVQGDEVGVIEAYLHASIPAGASGSVDLQLGHFILPTSRENVEFAWSSPYTLTFSALNTWIGEEMRLTGLLGEYEVAFGNQSLRFGASAFGGNDATGALLAWRGWAMGDRLTSFGEVVPLPPINSLQPGGAFAEQRDDGSKPYGDDLDDRLGWAGFLRWQRTDRAVLQYTRLDNRGDRELHQGEYAWRTEIDLFALELAPYPSFTLVGEFLAGSTGMGDPSTFRNVQADIESAYLLASWNPGRFRTTLRYDTFETVDVDGSGADNNNEDGEAWTLAFFWEPRDSLRLGLELVDLQAERPAALDVGADPNTDATSVQLELRYYFDW